MYCHTILSECLFMYKLYISFTCKSVHLLCIVLYVPYIYCIINIIRLFCICVFRVGLVCTICVTYLLLFNGNCWKIPFSWFMMIFKPVLLLKDYWCFLHHFWGYLDWFWFWKVLNFAIELILIKERFVHSRSWLKENTTTCIKMEVNDYIRRYK